MWKYLLLCCPLLAISAPANAHSTTHATASHTRPTARAPSTPGTTLSALDTKTVIDPVQQEPDSKRTETLCLALSLYHEARGEQADGQLAVGHVVLNRVHRTGENVCQTIWKHGQFSWTRAPAHILVPHDLTAWKTVQETAVTVMTKPQDDNTDGATMFYNARKCHPRWAQRGRVTARIGPHVFIRI